MTMPNLKSQIRTTMKNLLENLKPDELHTRSVAAGSLLAATPQFRKAQMIMLFLSMPGEVETSTLVVRSWSEGKQVAVPRVDWDNIHMVPVEINSLDTGLKTVRYGVREPAVGKVVPLDLIDLIVVPGIAFDRNGYRVGRGRGFYDRFLAQRELRAVRCGLCFHEQLIEDVPREAHDATMDLIVTDREAIQCGDLNPIGR